ncbi:hypothetical protein L2E82_38935 [Cichorium intybus]|uniref:Uncharacterized protein n=1 Tax=Cichorium intybus TaxID=13427 RepID=A0ACB9AGT3_CICIN|nr:hypothetical protein L2E82_38935 [Cichorium intybus]
MFVQSLFQFACTFLPTVFGCVIGVQRGPTIESSVTGFPKQRSWWSSIESVLNFDRVDHADTEQPSDSKRKVRVFFAYNNDVYGRFLRMFLGPINVCANRQDIQFKVKEEYYSFRVSYVDGDEEILSLKTQKWGILEEFSAPNELRGAKL